MTSDSPARSSSKAIRPDLVQTLNSLKTGQKIRVTQLVRVGYQQWNTTTTGTYRDVNYLVTGLSTERVRSDDIVVVTVHFTKENGEHSSISLDENTKIEAI